MPIRVPPDLARIRSRWDYAAFAGAQPHVTVMYPFLPCSELLRAGRADLAEIARRVPAFDVRFERVRRFDGLVWIGPEPAAPFVACTAGVIERRPATRL